MGNLEIRMEESHPFPSANAASKREMRISRIVSSKERQYMDMRQIQFNLKINDPSFQQSEQEQEI